MKKKIITSAQPNTPAQLTQRGHFAAMTTLSRMFGMAIMVGMRHMATSMTEYNMFMKLNKMNVSGASPGPYVMDFTEMIVSRGTSGAMEGMALGTIAANSVILNWANNTDFLLSLEDDFMRVQMYNETMNKFSFPAQNPAWTRLDMTATIPIPTAWQPGDVVHMYPFFEDSVNNRVSDNVYMTFVCV